MEVRKRSTRTVSTNSHSAVNSSFRGYWSCDVCWVKHPIGYVMKWSSEAHPDDVYGAWSGVKVFPGDGRKRSCDKWVGDPCNAGMYSGDAGLYSRDAGLYFVILGDPWVHVRFSSAWYFSGFSCLYKKNET